MCFICFLSSNGNMEMNALSLGLCVFDKRSTPYQCICCAGTEWCSGGLCYFSIDVCGMCSIMWESARPTPYYLCNSIHQTYQNPICPERTAHNSPIYVRMIMVTRTGFRSAHAVVDSTSLSSTVF